MYEVLALTMKIVKRPQADVERVLLSITDFTPKDVPNLLYSAAYLTRFDADEQALKLYQQASSLQPARAEPYILALNLADKLENVEAVKWAAVGILRYDWMKDHPKRHKLAIQKMKDWQTKLVKNGKPQLAEEMERALSRALVRDLTVRLEWSGEGDLDLLIEEPDGTTCSFENRLTRGGGALVHDGSGLKADDCYEEYVVAYSLSGHYRVHIKHILGKIVGKRAQLIITRYKGTPKEMTKRISVALDAKEVVYKISLNQGRRKDLSKTAPMKEMETTGIGKPRRMSGAEFRRRFGDRQSIEEFEKSRQQSASGAVTQQVGFAPVITPLSEGASLSANAVISADRRYVRIGVVPLFTNITDVFTFGFVNFGGNRAAAGNAGNVPANNAQPGN